MGDTTTEKLRLEIEVAAKDALKALTATSDEIKRLAKEALGAVPPANDLKATITKLQSDLKSSGVASDFLGDKLGGLKERQALLRSTMVDLIQKGITPETKELQDLKAQYDSTTSEIKSFGDENENVLGKLEKLASLAAQFEMAKKVAEFGAESVRAFAEMESATTRLNLALELRGMSSAKQSLNELADTLQKTAGIDADYVTQLEAELIAQGKSQEETEKLIKAAAGLSAVNGDELAPNMQKLIMTLAGAQGRVGNLIPEIKNLTDEQLKHGAAIDIVLQKYAPFIGQSGQTEISLKRMKAGSEDLQKAIGEGLAPVFRVGADILSGFASIVSKSGGVIKTILAAGVAALTGALVGLAAKTAIQIVAQWGWFASIEATNIALAVTNPLILAGVAATAVAVAAVVAYSSAQRSSASATTDAGLATADATSAIQDYAAAYRDMLASQAEDKQIYDARSKGFAALSLARLEEIKASDEAILKIATGPQPAIEEDLKRITTIIDAKKKEIADATRAAEEFKKGWASTYGADQASSSMNPYASIEFDRATKLAEADAAGIKKLNQKILDEINAYYDSKHQALLNKIVQDEKAAWAKLTETKVDDLQLELTAQIANLNDRETKAIASAKDTGQDVNSIHARYLALRMMVEAKAAKDISDTQKAEALAAATAAFDLANKGRALSAALTATKVDDLELARDRELAVYQGTEAQKLELTKNYARQIADAQIEEDKRVFAERLSDARKNGNYGEYASLATQSAMAPTQVGQMMGLGGQAAADPMSMLIQEAVDFAMSIENVKKVLNPLTTLLEGARPIIEPLINNDLQPLVDDLSSMGQIIGQDLAPTLNIAAVGLGIFATAANIVQIPIKLLGVAFTWFNDSVIVPVGNGIISFVNGIITAINSVLGWLGVNIPTIAALKTSTQIANEQAEIAAKLSQVSDAIDEVKKVFDERKKDLDDAYSKNVSSLQNLLKLGAITEAGYASRMTEVTTQYNADKAALEALEEAQAKTLQGILDRLNDGINVSSNEIIAAISTASTALGVDILTALAPATTTATTVATTSTGGFQIRPPQLDPGFAHPWRSFAVGTLSVDEDQVATVHKDEAIIPASFAQGLRSGEISLGKGSGGTTIIISSPITVQGSVSTEDGIADAVATRIRRRVKKGLLEDVD